MRKLLSAVTAVLICIIAFTIRVSAYSAGIDDRAGLFSESEKKQLEEKQEMVSELTGWNIAVVTTDIGLGTNGSRAIDYAEKYYDDTFGSDSSSVVYLIDIDYRFISMDGDVLNYFNTSRFDTMMDACEKKYMNYDDVGNLEQFYYYLEYFYKNGTVPLDSNIGAKGKNYDPGHSSSGIIFSPIPGIIAAVIAIVIVTSNYKFHHAAPPNIYLNGNSINIYNRRDVFIREFTTRTRISDESSHSGGGSHHSSHGGRSHGGGGRGGRR